MPGVHMHEGRIGVPLITLERTESTNKYAAELLSQGKVAHGAVIVAHEQTAGRGQRGRIWHSQAGADLAMSVVLGYKRLEAGAQFTLSKAVALAVHDMVTGALGGSAVEVRIKWPNDVLCGSRKIAGILIASELMGSQVRNSIVGIGINLNGTGFPEGLNATGLRLETGRDHDRMVVLGGLCERLEHWLNRWQAGSDEIAVAYADRLWARGRWVAFELDGVPFTARLMDVDVAGRLLVEDEAGEVRALGHDRLRLVRA
ncbi:MAG: biotin--[acetyl-CoA-carboxylase] ligase [Bacteroidetes bacterium]|nr:biotin--[acetyl-CoA-carboxylase] ligase [Bacteroidota bacterium]MBX7130038.1 biotin--[acetyl-CoA-carboxylase] ligase [Flavobacteriales bacterium]MCC6653783.1 biotin--[acetyl-CoA-carboxylase] ligase [Flavobacteriales bacterium]HMU14377.1 biotin--[acetyl-CoA-carboxylase] ligase [Flavobacteriales bacterium]HMZ48749.1 biotin--[acetyl-CoA-carboxylase] ligase [Flavobacteriales bacterium]